MAKVKVKDIDFTSGVNGPRQPVVTDGAGKLPELDASRLENVTVADGSITETKLHPNVVAQLGGGASALPNNNHIGQFLAKAATQPVRVLLTGTSIASFDVSAIQVLAKELEITYGSSGIVHQLGVYGGTYDEFKYKKQNYSGGAFTRLVMQPGNEDLVGYNGCFDKFILVYSKESDGGSFDVYIDDVFKATLTSNGAQQFNVEAVFNFPNTDFRRITIKAPASGRAYLERIELLLNKPGVIIENDTMGGFGAKDFYDAPSRTPGNGNLAGIATIGEAGTDSFFGRTGETKADVIIFQHFTNDGPSDYTKFQSVLIRAVAKTKLLEIPLVLVTEQPAIAFVTDQGTLNDDKTALHNVVKAAAINKHISLVDWIEMVDFSDKTAYRNKYYGDDTTHPLPIGHQIPMGPLLDLFNLKSSGYQNSTQLLAVSEKKAFGSALIVNSVDKSVYGGVAKVLANSIYENRFVVGFAMEATTGILRKLYFSSKIRNRVYAGDNNDTIAASPDGVDKYGPYKNSISSNFTVAPVLSPLGIEETATVVLLARRTGSGSVNELSIGSGGNNINPRFYLDDVQLPIQNGKFNLFNGNPYTTEAPVYYYFNVKVGIGSSLGFDLSMTTGRLQVYGIWVTTGKIPTITAIENNKRRELGAPLPMPEDLALDRVVVDQTYVEYDSTIEVEKVAIDAYCSKPINGATTNGIYRCLNKAAAGFKFLKPYGTINSNTYSDYFGGNVINNREGQDATYMTLLTGLSTALAGVKHTLLLRLSETDDRNYVVVYFNNPNLYLQADGSWSETKTVLTTGNRGENIALSFTFPTAAQMTALGSQREFMIRLEGTNTLTIATLVQGSSACV